MYLLLIVYLHQGVERCGSIVRLSGRLGAVSFSAHVDTTSMSFADTVCIDPFEGIRELQSSSCEDMLAMFDIKHEALRFA